jgi:hypothetical protein
MISEVRDGSPYVINTVPFHNDHELGDVLDILLCPFDNYNNAQSLSNCPVSYCIFCSTLLFSQGSVRKASHSNCSYDGESDHDNEMDIEKMEA